MSSVVCAQQLCVYFSVHPPVSKAMMYLVKLQQATCFCRLSQYMLAMSAETVGYLSKLVVCMPREEMSSG